MEKPTIPRYLDKVARKEWRRIVPLLEENGTLAATDRAILSLYCSAYSEWVEARSKVRELGAVVTFPTGAQQKSPWQQIADKAQDQLRKYASDLGLSPAARGRVTAAPDANAEDDFFKV